MEDYRRGGAADYRQPRTRRGEAVGVGIVVERDGAFGVEIAEEVGDCGDGVSVREERVVGGVPFAVGAATHFLRAVFAERGERVGIVVTECK